jgi:hypothetical protein
VTNEEISQRTIDEVHSSLELYREIQRNSAKVLGLSLASKAGLAQSRSHAFTAELELWLGAVKSRPESELFDLAIREYQLGLILLSQGFYRHAFGNLRLFLELSLAAVYFSAYLVQLREWQHDMHDISWSQLSCPENGILSVRFSNAFCSGLQGEVLSYLTMAKKLHRECSEYVHGNPSVMAEIGGPIVFNERIFFEWHSKADSAALLVTFTLAMRYLDELTEIDLRTLETAIVDRVGHVQTFRAKFGGSVEAT